MRQSSLRLIKVFRTTKVTHSNYEAAQEWLLEDEYERVKDKLLAEEVF